MKRYDKKLEEDAWVPSDLLEAAKDGDLARCAHPQYTSSTHCGLVYTALTHTGDNCTVGWTVAERQSVSDSRLATVAERQWLSDSSLATVAERQWLSDSGGKIEDERQVCRRA